MHYSRIMPPTGDHRYFTSTAVFLNELIKLGISLTPQERLEVFGSTALEDLVDEAERGFGGTAEWPQQHRTSGYTVQDWQQLAAESASIHQRLLDAMNDQVPAGDPAVMDLAEEHRRHTDRWFHD